MGFTERTQPEETELPGRTGNGIVVPAHQVHDLFPALVTPKELIGTFSCLSYSNAVVARELGQKVDWHADRICDGFVLQVNHAWKKIDEVTLAENALMVNSSDAGCESTGQR